MPHPRCTLIPLPDHQVAFQVDGADRLRWHFGPQYPRPFFYPLPGPASGRSLTRMGHPGAPNHDHHRSVWFAHEKVQRRQFLGRHHRRPRPTEGMARLRGRRRRGGDGRPARLVRRPRPEARCSSRTCSPPSSPARTAKRSSNSRPRSARPPQQLEFGKTNFGFLAVRVAKAFSVSFGGGTLTNSAGTVGEPAIFGKPAAWVDYCGKQPGDDTEGITFFDHPSNPGHPTAWHVREDGWMGASACFAGPRTITRAEPLALRYLLHAHRGPLDPKRAAAAAAGFAGRPGFELVKAPAKHTAFGVRRGRAA